MDKDAKTREAVQKTPVAIMPCLALKLSKVANILCISIAKKTDIASQKRVSMNIKEKIYGLAAITILFFLSGCNITAPRPRMGTLPTPPPGPRFSDPNNLGKHSYYFNPFEKNGILYTCKAGHIDLTHLRWDADYTRYAVKRIRKTLMKKKKGFSFTITWERSRHKYTFGYPENWDDLSKEEKEKIVDEIAFELGPYIAFNATLWHEILTWFGTHFAGFEPEFNSAFSWEDMYSNVLGTKLAVEALKDPNNKYDMALTLAINREIERLGVQSRKTAIDAVKKMRGKWFTGTFNVITIRKNMDIGLDDGYISPVLVPGICEDAEPVPLAAPTADILAKHGFTMNYEIYPHEWEKGKIYKVVYNSRKGKKILPQKHFPILLNHIRKVAVEKYGYIID